MSYLTKPLKFLVSFVALLALALVGASPAAADATGSSNSKYQDSEEVVVETADQEEGRWASISEVDEVITPLQYGPVISAGGCNYMQGVDYPHYSGGDVSVHGWWGIDSGDCPSTANVSVVLQAVWCVDSSGACYWRNVDSSATASYSPGGGAGNRANARVQCGGSSTVGFRGVGDVDLPWIVDPAGKQIGTGRDLNCYPF